MAGTRGGFCRTKPRSCSSARARPHGLYGWHRIARERIRVIATHTANRHLNTSNGLRLYRDRGLGLGPGVRRSPRGGRSACPRARSIQKCSLRRTRTNCARGLIRRCRHYAIGPNLPSRPVVRINRVRVVRPRAKPRKHAWHRMVACRTDLNEKGVGCGCYRGMIVAGLS